MKMRIHGKYRGFAQSMRHLQRNMGLRGGECEEVGESENLESEHGRLQVSVCEWEGASAYQNTKRGSVLQAEGATDFAGQCTRRCFLSREQRVFRCPVMG